MCPLSRGAADLQRLHDYNISQKVQVVVEHFRENVQPLLKGPRARNEVGYGLVRRESRQPYPEESDVIAFVVEGFTPHENQEIQFAWHSRIMSGYFHALGIPLIRGARI